MSGLARIEADDRDGAHHVRVRGEVDLSNASEVMDAIFASMPTDASRVVVDLSETDYFDSAGIAMLFGLAARLRYRRRELRLVVPADAHIRAVVELTNMHRVIPIDDALIDPPDPD